MPSSLAEYSTHAREDEMRERRDNALPGCLFLLMAIALVGTFLQALINSALAPMNASWLLMAARACAHSVCLPFVGGRHRFWRRGRMSLALSKNGETRP
jgi:hypothetical protein